jgi:hypothetical protein
MNPDLIEIGKLYELKLFRYGSQKLFTFLKIRAPLFTSDHTKLVFSDQEPIVMVLRKIEDITIFTIIEILFIKEKFLVAPNAITIIGSTYEN